MQKQNNHYISRHHKLLHLLIEKHDYFDKCIGSSRGNQSWIQLMDLVQAASGSKHWQSLQNMVETLSPQQSPPSQPQSSVFKKSLQMLSPNIKLKNPYQHGSKI